MIKTRPKALVVAPFGLGRFRSRQTSKLAQITNEHFIKAGLPVITTQYEDLPEDAPGSLMTNNFYNLVKGMTKPRWVYLSAQMQRIMEVLDKQWTEQFVARARVNAPEVFYHGAKLAGFRQSYLDKNHSGYMLNIEAEITSLRELFQASCELHEASPWKVLSNEQYLHMADEESGNEFYVVVTGFTDYSGRGLAVFATYDDMRRAINNVDLNTVAFKLNFFSPVCSAFSVLEDISALKLPIASNIEDGDDAPIPIWYGETASSIFHSFDEMVDRFNEHRVTHDLWPLLARITRVVTFYASNRSLCCRRPGSRIAIIREGPISLEGFNITPGHQTYRPMSFEEAAEQMPIGSRDNCNFCRKPSESKMKQECTRCGIFYCSIGCKEMDMGRHEAQCGEYA